MKDWVTFFSWLMTENQRPVGQIDEGLLQPIGEDQSAWRTFIYIFLSGFANYKEEPLITEANVAFAQEMLEELILYGLNPDNESLERETIEVLRFAIHDLQDAISKFKRS